MSDVVRPMHVHSLRTVTSVSVRILNSTTTLLPPPFFAPEDVYQEASKIVWIITGTLALFAVSVGAIGVCRATLGKQSTRQSQSQSASLWDRVSGLFFPKQYRQFSASSDLNEFQLDDDEVTIELQEM